MLLPNQKVRLQFRQLPKTIRLLPHPAQSGLDPTQTLCSASAQTDAQTQTSPHWQTAAMPQC
jgi:hypothetical protein